MLVARDSSGSRRVAVPELRGEAVRCPDCAAELIVRCGDRNVAHFAHRPGQRCTPSSRRSSRRARRRDLDGQQPLFDLPADDHDLDVAV